MFERRDLREWKGENEKTQLRNHHKLLANWSGKSGEHRTPGVPYLPSSPTRPHTTAIHTLALALSGGHKKTEGGKEPMFNFLLSPVPLSPAASANRLDGGGDQDLLPSPWKCAVIPQGRVQDCFGNQKMKFASEETWPIRAHHQPFPSFGKSLFPPSSSSICSYRGAHLSPVFILPVVPFPCLGGMGRVSLSRLPRDVHFSPQLKHLVCDTPHLCH